MVSFKFISSIAFAAVTVLGASSAAAPTNTDAPAGTEKGPNPIIKPSWGTVGKTGKSMDITWKPTTSGKVNLILRGGDSKDLDTLYTIASNVDNTGSYKWDISDKTSTQTSYSIEIQDADNEDSANYSPYFTILDKAHQNDVSSSSSSSSGSSTASETSSKTKSSKSKSTSDASTTASDASTTSATKMSQTTGSSSTASDSTKTSSAATTSSSASTSASEDGVAAKPTGGLLALAAGIGAVALL